MRLKDIEPAYQDPDRRGRASYVRLHETIERMERFIIHTDIHLRIRTLVAEAGRKLRAATQS
jgi:hypothetical protein